MGERGRPKHPDILTPREWEVLAHLRDGLSNPEIARRLGITVEGAKYHVSEILGKLTVSSREEAAAWRPEHRPWWATIGAPLQLWRHVGAGWLSRLAAAAVALVVAAGVGLLVWALIAASGAAPAPVVGSNASACPNGVERQLAGRSIPSMQLVTTQAGWAWIDRRLMWVKDGGATWHEITPLGLTPRSPSTGDVLNATVFFLNATTGWVAMSQPGPQGDRSPAEIVVWRTTDTGATWLESGTQLPGRSVPSDGFGPPDLRMINIDFIDAQHGWLAANYLTGMMGQALLFTTNDGGATWRELASLEGFNGAAGPIHMLNADDGWWKRNGPEETHRVTHDGGTTWHLQSLPVPSQYYGFAADDPIRVSYRARPGSLKGEMAQTLRDDPDGVARDTAIYVTADGGLTWSLASTAPAAQGPIAFANATAWFQDVDGTLFATQNAGQSWSRIDADWPSFDPLGDAGERCSVGPLGLSFVGGSHGWAILRSEHWLAPAVQRADALIATSDGGRTWTLLSE